MKKTGVYATPVELAELRKLGDDMISALCFGDRVEAISAWEAILERQHEMALSHGLPAIPGKYGRMNDGEFIVRDYPESLP